MSGHQVIPGHAVRLTQRRMPVNDLAVRCGLAGCQPGKSDGSAVLAGLATGEDQVDLLVVLAVLAVIAWLRGGYK
jgi:hypothetical protein